MVPDAELQFFALYSGAKTWTSSGSETVRFEIAGFDQEQPRKKVILTGKTGRCELNLKDRIRFYLLIYFTVKLNYHILNTSGSTPPCGLNT